MTDHPITPPPELMQQWVNEASGDRRVLITQAARWGADQELDACCADLRMVLGPAQADWLRSVRRPKPPSLAEQALKALDHLCVNHSKATDHENTIRRAMERLQELEGANG
jgi:hypothetical protein